MSARILVIEDDQAVVHFVAHVLTTRGHEPRVVRNALDGVRTAVEERPDLILAGLSLPEMDGYELVTAIRNQAGMESMKVLALAASADGGGPSRDGSGFDGWISNLRDPERFIEALAPFLPQTGAEPDTAA
jgi:CheY-like chemotaxis protein